MQVNSNSSLAPTLSTTSVTRSPSAPIHVSSEAMPVTLENPAQTLLNELTEKITALNPREKEQVENYLKIWTDVLAIVPGMHDDIEDTDPLQEPTAQQSASTAKQVTLQTILEQEPVIRQNLFRGKAIGDPSVQTEINELATALHQITRIGIGAMRQESAQPQDWQAMSLAGVDDKKAIAEARRLAKKETASNAFFKQAIELFDKAQNALALQSDNWGPDGTVDTTQANNIEADIKFLQKFFFDKNKFLDKEKATATNLLALLTRQVDLLKLREAENSTYRSPKAAASIMDGRRLQVQAAVSVIDALLAPPRKFNGNAKSAAEKLRAQLVERMESMQTYIEIPTPIAGQSADVLMGRPSMKPIEKKLFPEAAKAQDAQIDCMVNFAKLNLATELIHADLTEFDLMEKLITQYVVPDLPPGTTVDVATLLREARARTLDQGRDWAPIDSTFTVPISIGTPASADTEATRELNEAVSVNTLTTPIGNVFEGAQVTILSQGSAIQKNDFDDYRVTDPSDPTKKITPGRNSHSALESKHAVNLAKSVSNFFGKCILNVTRHATLSPYKFSRTSLQSMNDVDGLALMKDLGRISTTATRIAVTSAATEIENEGQDAPLAMQEVDRALLNAIMLAKASDKTIPDRQANARDIAASPIDLLALARLDSGVCSALRRKAALNRSREVFLSEVTTNPALLARIAAGETIHFNSISLLTPDPFREFLATHLPFLVGASDNEKRMLADQNLAWQDLQAELTAGGLDVNGKTIKAEIHAMNVGVNPLAFGMAPLPAALVSGWSTTHEQNNARIEAMIGAIDKAANGSPGGRMQTELAAKQIKLTHLTRLENELKKDASPASVARQTSLKNEIAQLDNEIRAITELSKQIATIWQSGSYQKAGRDPYKLATRLAMLSSLLGEATAFNCKSGKDRTAQLDVELKFLAFQIFTNNGHVPEPDRERSALERHQLAAFVFKDKSRTQMQVYNTGFMGSKLAGLAALTDNFTAALEAGRASVVDAFQGMSKAVLS